ncbi:MAG: HEAT repeat domain-containing protein [bacterium]
MSGKKEYIKLFLGVISSVLIAVESVLAQTAQPLPPATVRKLETGIANIRTTCSKTDDIESIGWSIGDAMNVFSQTGKTSIPYLTKVLLDKKEDYKTRFFMAVILGEVIPDTQSTHYLISVLQDKSETELLRGECATAIGFIKDTTATNVLIDNLYNSSIPFRITVINAIGPLKDKRSVPPLIELLNDNNKDIQMVSAKALGIIGDKIATTELMKKVLEGNPNDERYINIVKANAINSLVSIGGADVEGFLIELLTNNKSNDLKIDAAIGLGTLKSKKAVPILIKQLKSNNQLLIMHTAESLSLIGAVSAEQPIRETLNNVKSEYVKSRMNKSLDKLLQK